MAYRDPNHRLQHLDRCVMSYCLRILECLALAPSGTPRDDVVY
jgi:hypothetical protein